MLLGRSAMLIFGACGNFAAVVAHQAGILCSRHLCKQHPWPRFLTKHTFTDLTVQVQTQESTLLAYYQHLETEHYYDYDSSVIWTSPGAP